MAVWDAWIGAFYQHPRPIVASDTAINIYTETRDVEGSPKMKTILGTPGRRHEATVATLGNRGWFQQDGRTWTVVGDQLYERTAPAVYVARGTIANDGRPVSFASNGDNPQQLVGQGGNQLGIVGGDHLYVLNLVTHALTPVTLPFTGPVMIVYQDGYGLINQRDSPLFWYSALFDFTSWDALDFASRSASSDHLVGLVTTRDRVWVFGTRTTTIYYNSGDVDVPWVPYPGTTMQIGAWSPHALGVYNDAVVWLARSPHGIARVCLATDASPRTISTPPIDAWLARCPTLVDAELLLYEQQGHAFAVFTCPDSPEDICTYGFDLKEALWAARAGWDQPSGQFTRWRARGCTVAGMDVLVGDYQTGALYTLDLTTYTDGEQILVRERTAPYLADDPSRWLFLDQVELDVQPGVGLVSGQGVAPVVELQVSRDGAQTWVSAGFAPIGALGKYLTRTRWRRLGRARGDRLVLRIRQTDPVPCCWQSLSLHITAGTGQL